VKVTRELALHGLLQERLGELVPSIVAVGDPTDVFPYPIVVYERARGRQGQTLEGPIIRPKPWARTRLAGELASALTALHKTPLKPAKAVGVSARRVVLDDGVDASEEAIAWARRVAGNAVDAFLVDPLPTSARKPAKGVLCHADLKGEHLYVSEDGTRLTAILDWADAEIVDPAVDLAGLAIWLGPSFVREVVRGYGGVADEGTAERAVFLARAGLLSYLDQVLHNREAAPPPGVVDAQLRAAFLAD
jgi:aminoglycoside phosphotransferase (APT) family kinase protein